MGSTMAPTMLWGSNKRNVMPARATAEVDIRILPGTTADDVEGRGAGPARRRPPLRAGAGPRRSSRQRSSPVDGVVPAAIAAFLGRDGDPARRCCRRCARASPTATTCARPAGTAAYGFSPFRATPAEVLEAGYHNANERVHVDDLLLSTRFHVDLARQLLS